MPFMRMKKRRSKGAKTIAVRIEVVMMKLASLGGG
jgi:hypothetical protein